MPGLKIGIYRHAEVAGCPIAAYVPSQACGIVGTWTKQETSGSISSSGSGTETDWTYRITLYRDGFYTYEQSSFKSTCYSYNCNYTSNSAQDEVGRWGLNSSNVYWYMSTASASAYNLTSRLAGYSYAASTTACPGP